MMTQTFPRSLRPYITDMNWEELQEIWPLPGPWSLRPIVQGINNLTQIIETPAGNYILRIYDSGRPLEHIGYELSLLGELQKVSLPFRIPAPIPAVTGELFAIYSGKIITMSPWLAGLPPQNDNLEQAWSAGQALAELGQALRGLQIETTLDVVPFPLSADFEAWGKIDVHSAETLLLGLPLKNEELSQMLALVERMRVMAPALYRTSPVQIIHRDYDQSNILMEGNSVIGVLDFEFCGPDLRILDLAYALSTWPWGWWNTGLEWQIMDAFGRGYVQVQELPVAELELLPLVFQLRMVTGLFFRLGRYQRNLETEKSMLARAREVLSFERWLCPHEEQLLVLVRSWSA